MFQKNIGTPGRVLRACAALGAAFAGLVTWPHSRLGAAFLAGTAVFLFFEAARGWCAARACGIKTPL